MAMLNSALVAGLIAPRNFTPKALHTTAQGCPPSADYPGLRFELDPTNPEGVLQGKRQTQRPGVQPFQGCDDGATLPTQGGASLTLGFGIQRLQRWPMENTPRPATRHQTPDTRHSSRHQTPDTSPRRGLTLVEMLVSLVCVILLMLAYTQLFAEVGARIGDARAAIDMTNRLRSAAQTLRSDLAGVTVEMLPWQRPESGAGYFEIVDGLKSDPPPASAAPFYRNNGTSNDPFPFGDTDDLLMFTVRSKGAPFTGKFWVDVNTDGIVDANELRTVQSEVAEIVWFLRPSLQPDPADPANPKPTNPPTFTLYRRMFLVMPTYAGSSTTFSYTGPPLNPPPFIPPAAFYDVNDISARFDGSRYVANTLADLTKRECRYGHWVNFNDEKLGFPHPPQHASIVPFGGSVPGSNYTIDFTNPRYGEDVVLTNVLAFDVQVWDPTAPVYVVGTAPNEISVAPGDPGFAAAAGALILSAVPKSLGAYVDLNWAGSSATWGSIPNIQYPVAGTNFPMSPFYSTGHPKSRLHVGTLFVVPPSDYAIFDTWSFHYEHDGLNQDGKDQNGTVVDDFTDEGTDGFDNPHGTGPDPTRNLAADTNYTGGVDDPDERETSPPYPVPLRGIKVRLRVYEPDTRQIREVSVVHSFVPE